MLSKCSNPQSDPQTPRGKICHTELCREFKPGHEASLGKAFWGIHCSQRSSPLHLGAQKLFHSYLNIPLGVSFAINAPCL